MQESIYNFASNLETIFSPVLELIEVHSVANIYDDAGLAQTSAYKCIKKLVINTKEMEESHIPTRPAVLFFLFSCLHDSRFYTMNVLLFVSCLCYHNETIYCYMWYCKIYFEECWLFESKDFEDMFTFKAFAGW